MTAERTMPRVWSVAELTQAIRGSLEERFASVDLEAEVSGYKLYPSGHAYFTLKDGEAQISAVFFKSCREACPDAGAVRDGAKVKVRGRVTVGPNSRCQIVVRRLKPVGEGELMARYQALKAKLESEGLFAAERKRPLPFLPRRIGLVTSPAGAVIHDMCRVLMRRFPAVEIRLFPAVVQGAAAPASVIAGLRHFNDPANPWRADLVIFGRGGGSFEDLFCFNDEALVREIAASRVPTVSAVGHETDFTLADFAADRRAGTPSIAAELAVPVLSEIRTRLKGAEAVLVSSLRGRYEWCSQRLDKVSASLLPALQLRRQDLSHRLASLSAALTPALQMKCQDAARRLDALSAALSAALELARVRAEARLQEAARSLELLSPFGVLERGYSLTTDARGAIVRAADAVAPGERITTRLASGTLVSTVEVS